MCPVASRQARNRPDRLLEVRTAATEREKELRDELTDGLTGGAYRRAYMQLSRECAEVKRMIHAT